MSDFHGLPTLTLQNPYFSLDVLSSGGPRLVRLVPAGDSINLFAEVPDMFWGIPGNEYYPLGGHRLWAAPEVAEITYLPDHLSVDVEDIPGGLRLSHEDDRGVHYRRVMQVTLDPGAPKMTVVHTLTNLGQQSVSMAPWSITQFKLGGRAILPASDEGIDGSEFIPNRSLVLWPYTDLKDERLSIGNRAVEVNGLPCPEALKVGVFSTRGWAAVEFPEGWVVVKYFKVGYASTYTDLSANVQCYVRDRFLELETLGELRQLGQGQSVSHSEEWQVLPGSLKSLGLT